MIGLATFTAACLQVGIAILLIMSIQRSNGAAAVNAAISLFVSLVPAFLTTLFAILINTQIIFDSLLTLWIAFAGFIHTVGMLGPYDSIWWYDHVTHTVSAALLATLLYAVLLVMTGLSTPVLAALVTSFGALGAVWEGTELLARAVGKRYGIEPVLIHYGWRDTAFDLIFDVIGAAIVILVDFRAFVPAIEQVIAVI